MMIIEAELAARHDVSALACVDGKAGVVLGVYAREDAAREVAELAALSAAQLCSSPSEEADGNAACEAFVASGSSVHAFARVPSRPNLLVVALANGDTNIALLCAWLRGVAGRVGQVA